MTVTEFGRQAIEEMRRVLSKAAQTMQDEANNIAMLGHSNPKFGAISRALPDTIVEARAVAAMADDLLVRDSISADELQSFRQRSTAIAALMRAVSDELRDRAGADAAS